MGWTPVILPETPVELGVIWLIQLVHTGMQACTSLSLTMTATASPTPAHWTVSFQKQGLSAVHLFTP